MAGDVAVGWINSKTGKGSVDDYFLAHTVNDGVKARNMIKCNDGAESCPDESKVVILICFKVYGYSLLCIYIYIYIYNQAIYNLDSSLFQGGKSHVELLNAVSRDNYTMITYRRPLKSSDTFDVRILTDPRTSQNIFWSVGYKSSAMRKKFKPDKNIGLVQINFGRRPQWNCPKGEDEEDVQAESIEAEDTFDFTFSPSASEKINAPSIIAPNVPKTSSEVISRKNCKDNTF